MLPILITAFNRPKSLEKLLKSILSQEHGDIYVHCDGPRNATDNLVFETQDVIKFWASKNLFKGVFFQNDNLGLMDSIHFAADWFFQKNEYGLILEDDLIIHSPALEEAERLWKIMADSDRVTVFSLGNPLPQKLTSKIPESYWYSDFFVSYAWCTDRTTWNNSIRSLEYLDYNQIHAYMKNKYGGFVAWNFSRFMRNELNKETLNRKSCSFAWRFTVDQISKGNKSIVSSKNRVGYSGFGFGSTNTTETHIWGSDFGRTVNLTIEEWQNPVELNCNKERDYYFVREFGFIKFLRSKLAIRTRIKSFLKIVS
jgi:glycosyltransferase involved in cell wall biosynthesis